MLADGVLSKLPGITYTGEIDFVWRYGASFRNHDVRFSGSESHIRYIRKWFDEFNANTPSNVVLDKTPSNSLRLAWLKTVFPESKVIHLIRDGRAVALSAYREWHGFSPDALDSADFRAMDPLSKIQSLTKRKLRLRHRVRDLRSLAETTAYLKKGLAAYSKVFGVSRSRNTWGPRPPGLATIARDCSALEACAFQWDQCVRRAMVDGAEYGNNYMELRYEDLLDEPFASIDNILEFIEFDRRTVNVPELADCIVGDPESFRVNSDPKDLLLLDRLLEPTLRHLRYK